MKHRAKRKKHKPKGHHRKSSGKHHRKPPPYHGRAPPLSFVQIQQNLHKREILGNYFLKSGKNCIVTPVQWKSKGGAIGNERQIISV